MMSADGAHHVKGTGRMDQSTYPSFFVHGASVSLVSTWYVLCALKLRSTPSLSRSLLLYNCSKLPMSSHSWSMRLLERNVIATRFALEISRRRRLNLAEIGRRRRSR